ncbi:hypothetical protein GIB67_041781, partial [Kingdonia uniflora]
MVTRILKSRTRSVRGTIDLWIQGQLFQRREFVFQVLVILDESMAILLDGVLVGRGNSFSSDLMSRVRDIIRSVNFSAIRFRLRVSRFRVRLNIIRKSLSSIEVRVKLRVEC